MVGGHEFCRPAHAIAKAKENRRRFVGEVEGAGDNVAGRIDHQARGGPGAKKHLADSFQAADGFDPHDRWRHAIDGRPEGCLPLRVGVVGRRRQRRQAQQRRHGDEPCQGISPPWQWRRV